MPLRSQVAEMFNNIAQRYDFLNHFLSFGIDRVWRRKAIQEVKRESPCIILDVATGTGDFAIEAMRANPEKIVGIDISEEMLEVGHAKIKDLGLEGTIELQYGDSEDIGFESETFDAVTVAFGVRNLEHLMNGIKEMHRVLKVGGIICILEFSKPKLYLIRQLYRFYSFVVIPFVGRLFSKDKQAYMYLPESVEKFPCGSEFVQIMAAAGFSGIRKRVLTQGIVTIYTGKKEKCSKANKDH